MFIYPFPTFAEARYSDHLISTVNKYKVKKILSDRLSVNIADRQAIVWITWLSLATVRELARHAII